MLLRLSFVLLIALNIALAAWLALGQSGEFRHPQTDPGVPRLALLSERGAVPAGAATVPSAASSVAAEAAPVPMPAGRSVAAAVTEPGARCVSLGPFASQSDLQQARRTLAPRVLRSRTRQEQALQPNGWWVHLPASASRARALALTRQLAARHLSDYFITAGPQGITVSLGLFRDRGNARKRRDQVIAAGFPAQLTARNEPLAQFWLDLVFAEQADTNWRRRVLAPGVASHSTACF